jgi:uncharacterized protein YidB (DUF937 family)
MGFWDIFKRPSKKTEEAAASAAAAGGAVTAGAAATVESVANEAAAGGGSAIENALAAEWKEVGKLFGEAGEKFSGLMDKLNVGGLDDKLKSWIGKGDNEPVTPEQVKTALGDEEVESVAKDMGVSKDEAASRLAKILPTVIDKLTPDGLVPDPDGLADKLSSIFKRK